MMAQMMRGESEQLLGMASFLQSSPRLHTALRGRNWTDFACEYNGRDCASHSYDKRLAAAHEHLFKKGLPDFEARAVQLLLTYHGFDPGKIDGIVGERTRTAIAAFITKHKLPETRNHKDLRAALLETLPPAAAAPHAGPDLRIVQSLLEYLGWSPGPVDGKPGPRTRHAIGGFQRSCGTAATGKIDAGLLAALEETTRRGFGRNRSADTRLVQQLLAIRGFDPGGIDGLAGAKTKAAITAFAQAQGAPPADDLDTLNRLLKPKVVKDDLAAT
jgi:peptidoglycan hydrolase-like protein with peptidoglycan-binding domain